MTRAGTRAVLLLALAVGAARGARAQSVTEIAEEVGRRYERGEIAEAVATAEEGLRIHRIDPDATRLLAWLGRIHFEAGSFARAAEYLERTLAAGIPDGPDGRELGYRFGIALLRTRRWEEARAWFERLLDRDPDDALAHYGLGWVLLDRNEFDEAKRHFERAADLGVAPAAADRDYARTKEREMRDLRAANRRVNAILAALLVVALGGLVFGLRALRTARPAVVALVIFASWLALAPSSLGQDAEAFREFDRGYTLVQKGAGLLRQKRSRSEAMRALREGRAILVENVAKRPDYGPNYYGLALADLADGKAKEAEANLVACLERSPDYGPARDLLARHYLDGGRRDEARAVLGWYLEREESFDEQVDHFLAAAILLEDLGDHEGALHCAREAWARNITRFEPGSSGGSESPRLRTGDRKIPATLLSLCVNALVVGAADAGEWLALARTYPWDDRTAWPAGLAILEAARSYVQGEKTACVASIRAALAKPDGREAWAVLAPPSAEVPGATGTKTGKRGKAPAVKPFRDGGPRPLRDEYLRLLGPKASEFDRFLRTSLPPRLREDAERAAQGASGREGWLPAAQLARAAVALGDPDPPELLYLLAQACCETGEYKEAIAALDRALAAEPPEAPRYRELRARCVKERRRTGGSK